MGILTFDCGIETLVLISVTVFSLYLYLTRNYNYWKKQGVKEIAPTFPFGNVAPCIFGKKNPAKMISEMYQKGEGESMIGFYSFDKPYLILRDPELIKNILIRDFSNFSNKIMTGNTRDIFGSRSVFLINNPPWKHLRQKLTSIFTSGKLKNMLGLMLEICPDLYDYLDKIKIDDKVGKPVEIKEICGKLMTDLIGTTAFGIKMNSLKNSSAEFRNHGKKMFRSGYKRYIEMLAIFFMPPLRPLTNPKFFDEGGTDFLKKSFWDVINERIKGNIKRPDLIDLLIEIKKKQDEDSSDMYKLEGDTLVAQAAIFFTGGFETSATTTSFALYELAKNPEIQTRLRNEILEGLEKNQGKITYEMVTTLPYLDMLIHETLRLYPILPWLDRVPENDYVFADSNVTLKKGFPVILPLGALQQDPKYFPNPQKFDPERFSEDNKANIVPFTFFPFGEGPRNCIGARLGYIQAKLAVILFISKYEITFSQESPKRMELENLNVLTQPKGDLFLNLRKISS